MKKPLIKCTVFVIACLLSPVSINAQVGGGGGAGGGGITNPLQGIDGPQDFIFNVIQFLLGLSAILAFAAIIYGGIRLVASFGNDQNVRTGKSIILWAVIGIIVIMLSYGILNTVARFLNVGF